VNRKLENILNMLLREKKVIEHLTVRINNIKRMSYERKAERK
jgi:hypothetical protein